MQVVADEDHRHVPSLLQFAQQVDDLGLHRHVQRGGRFVGDQQHRIASQCRCQHHPLAHAARQLMGKGIDLAKRVRHADQRQQFDGCEPGL